MPLSAWAYKLLYKDRCTRCGFGRPRPKRSWCQACHTVYTREWRRRNPEARKRNHARLRAKKAQDRGIFEPQPCEDCEALEVEKHHPDYNKPLYFVWLCKPCHHARHRYLESLGVKL